MPVRTGPSRTSPAQKVLSHPESARLDPERAGSARTGFARIGSARIGPFALDGAHVTEITDPVAWDALVNEHRGHPLQLWGWGELKSEGEWTARRLRITGPFDSAVAQILVRRLPLPFKALAYVPRGPAVGVDGIGKATHRVAVMSAIVAWCRKNIGGVAVEFEPDWPEGTELPGLVAIPARNTILYPHTLVVDLTKPTDELFKELRKTTRYEIRKAERDGVTVRRVTSAAETRKVLDIYSETAQRAGFPLHIDSYYLAIPENFGDNSRLLAAYDPDGNICSFTWSIVSNETGFLLYGGQNQVGQHYRANPAVYWAAIKDAQELGCQRYDLNGLLGEGIARYKKGFAKHENMMIGTLDVPIHPALYAGWERALPLAKRSLRTLRGINRETLAGINILDPVASVQVVRDVLAAGKGGGPVS